jgi:hypothetical protein
MRNKSKTTATNGPLTPLPIPDSRGDSVAIDFIGPLPEDSGFNMLVSMTDRLNSDVRLMPCRDTILAEHFVGLFFDHWFCENGLPQEIVSDRNKIFLSKFWHAVTIKHTLASYHIISLYVYALPLPWSNMPHSA